MSKKLYFSPSDQTANLYAAGGTNEAAQCRQIARYAVEAAVRCGFEARTDADFTMERRVAESNAWGADAHIPIHTNAFNGEVQGAHIFYGSKAGRKLAEAIMAELAPIVPGGRHGVSEHLYYEVKYAAAPTAYVEAAFHDNPEEARWIIDHKRDIAEAIVKGCCACFGVAYVPANAEKPIYRVRKAWDDAASQLGAFVELDNAKRLADQNTGYSVYDGKGNVVYPNAGAQPVKTDYARSYDPTKAGTYTVNSTVGLNLRTGASVSKTSIEVMPNGSKVICYGYHTGEWLYVVAASGKKGFCHSGYLMK